MKKCRPMGLTINFVAWTIALLILPGCGGDGLPSQAIFHPGGAQALRASALTSGSLDVRGRVYVPVYSSIHWDGVDTITQLSATISIRNTDDRRPLVLSSVVYYDSLGKVIQPYVENLMKLDPMATVEFVIARPDTRGGNGANFLVDWGSAGPIAEPVMEAVMLGQIGTVGISFVSPGRPVRTFHPNESPALDQP